MTAGDRDASPFCRQQSILYSTPSKDSDETAASSEESPVETAPPMEPEGAQYPLNVPSPLLLASAMILAIVSTGG